MRITVVGRQMDIPKGFIELAERKLSKYDKFFKEDANSHITLKRRKNKEILELTITSSGMMFRAEEEDETFQNALDEVMNSIERQLRKNKTKLERKVREKVLSKEYLNDTFIKEPTESTEEETEAPVRVKEFVFKPMSTDEAILQMNMLGHTFFAFLNNSNNKICVVYERKDGKYGLIVPKTIV